MYAPTNYRKASPYSVQQVHARPTNHNTGISNPYHYITIPLSIFAIFIIKIRLVCFSQACTLKYMYTDSKLMGIHFPHLLTPSQPMFIHAPCTPCWIVKKKQKKNKTKENNAGELCPPIV
jgi:hypothetical protein